LFAAVIADGKLAHILADVLGLAPADGNIATLKHEIGRADLGDVLGFVDDGERRVDGGEQPGY